MLQNISIIYGTAWKKEMTTSLVVTAVLSGFRAIDTACQPKHYREDLVGVALEELSTKHGIKRDSLFLQTKYTPIGGQDTSKPLPYDPSTSITQQVNDSFATSLKNLKTTYLDSYILHSPLNTLDRTLEAWKVLCSLQDQGLVKNIGMSNTYDVKILEALERHGGRKPQVVQNRWYEGNAFDRDVVKYCRDNQIHYESFWTLTGTPALLHHRDILRLAQTKQVKPAQIVYRLVQHWGIIPLAGSTNELHMREGIAVEKIPLTDEEIPNSLNAMIWAE
ncbi:Aldo/keto reductase [Serendipita vermifera]|nr:Aldo/keto reductase [Serendipita vermifera]